MFGFLFTWTMFLILRPASEGVKALTLATYITEQFFPSECADEKSKGELLNKSRKQDESYMLSNYSKN